MSDPVQPTTPPATSASAPAFATTIQAKGKRWTRRLIIAAVVIMVIGVISRLGGGGDTEAKPSVTLAPAKPAGATEVKPSAETAPNASLSADELQEKISLIDSEMMKLSEQYDKLMVEHPAFHISGDIKDRSDTSVSVWGTAVPGDNDLSRMGTLTKDGHVHIINAPKESIIGSTYIGQRYYIEKRTGKNGFGAAVPVYVFGDAPSKALTLTAQIDRLDKEKSDLQDRLDKALEPSRLAFKEFIEKAEASVAARRKHLQAGPAGIPERITAKEQFATYLESLGKAVSTWKAQFEVLDKEYSSILTADVIAGMPDWKKHFPAMAEQWKQVEENESKYRKDRDGALSKPLEQVIAGHQAAIASFPNTVVTASDLSRLGTGIRSAIASTAKIGDDDGRILSCYVSWWHEARAAFLAKPEWATADEGTVLSAIDSLTAGDPNGVASGEYKEVIVKIEDDLGVRQLSDLSNVLATVNPWIETRQYGMTGALRVYHRQLLLRIDGNVTGENALAVTALVSEERNAHPEQWADTNIVTIYGKLQSRQLSAWSSRQLSALPDGILSSVSVVDGAMRGGALIPVGKSDFPFQLDVVLLWLTAIDRAKNPNGNRSALALDVAEVIKSAKLDPLASWHHGQLLIAANKNASAADIFAIDSVASKDSESHKDLWSDESRRLWSVIQASQFAKYDRKTNLLWTDGNDEAHWHSRLYPSSDYKLKDIYSDGKRSQKEKWEKICASFTRDEAISLKGIFSKPLIQKYVHDGRGEPDVESLNQIFTQGYFWDAVIQWLDENGKK